MRSSFVVLSALVLLGACGDGDDQAADTVAGVTTPAPPPDATEPPAATTAPVTASSPSTQSTPATPLSSVVPSAPASLPPGDSDLDRAIADVVARTGADPDAVTVLVHEEVTWRDAGIGCPQKGMQYLQVLTDGTRIVLEVDGRRFDYHAGGRRELFYCATPQPPVGS